MTRKFGSVPLVLGALLLCASSARAAEPDDGFFKGKQLRIIVSTDAAGAYDNYARVMAAHIVNYIPGLQTVVVQNMPGASGIRATSFIYNNAPRDGTYVAATHASVPTSTLASPDVATYDVNRLSWIGNITSDPFVAYVWHTSPVQSMEEAMTKEVIMGGVSVGAAGVDYAIVARELFGLKFKIVSGYKASNDVKIAMERGELHGTFANGWSSIKSVAPDWIRDKKIKVIIQHGFEPHPELPDVPLFINYARTEEEKQILTFLLSRQVTAKPYFGPPDLPPARLQVLRRAFDATIRDPKFIADTTKMNLALDGAMTGEQLANLVRKLAATPPAAVKRVNAMYDAFQANK